MLLTILGSSSIQKITGILCPNIGKWICKTRQGGVNYESIIWNGQYAFFNAGKV